MHKFLCFEYKDCGFLVVPTKNIVWKVLSCNDSMPDNNLQLFKQIKWTLQRLESIIFYKIEIHVRNPG